MTKYPVAEHHMPCHRIVIMLRNLSNMDLQKCECPDIKMENGDRARLLFSISVGIKFMRNK